MPDGMSEEVAARGARVSEFGRLQAGLAAVDDALMAPVAAAVAWADVLVAALTTLEEAFAHHRYVAESPGGTLELAAERRQGLARTVQRQRREHRDLLEDFLSKGVPFRGKAATLGVGKAEPLW